MNLLSPVLAETVLADGMIDRLHAAMRSSKARRVCRGSRIETTHIYAQADLEMKERALAKVPPVEARIRRFKPSDAALLATPVRRGPYGEVATVRQKSCRPSGASE